MYVCISYIFLVAALYKTTHPEYANYLYLMAPISLAILNPIAFVLMEIGKRRAAHNSEQLLINDGELPNSSSIHNERFKMIASVAKNIILNPIILMTILGVLGNFIFKHKVPLYLKGTLEVRTCESIFFYLSKYSSFLVGFRLCFFCERFILVRVENGGKSAQTERRNIGSSRNSHNG